MPRYSCTAMASRAESKRARLAALLAELRPEVVDQSLFGQLQQTLAPISESWLRQLLRQSGIPLTAAVEGVSCENFVELRRTLLALSEAYTDADASDRLALRRQALEAKQRLRFVLARAKTDEERATREEMLLRVLTWLENPVVFPFWLQLRERLFCG